MAEDIDRLKKQISNLKSRMKRQKQQLEWSKMIQKQNEEMLHFEKLLSELSHQFINLSPSEAKTKIESGFKLLADFMGLDLIAASRLYDDGKTAKMIYLYRRDHVDLSFPEELSSQFPWAIDQVRKGKTILWQNIPEDIPSEAENEKSFSTENNFKAFLTIPLIAGKTVIGGLGCISFSKPLARTDWIIQRFRLFGEMLANTMNRCSAEKNLQQAFSEIKNLNERLQAENLYLREEVNLQYHHGEIIGQSRAMKKVLKQVEQVAVTNTTVLLSGETGTGKELLAHAIHKLSPYKKKTLVTLNCAAIPPTLVESELFGHEAGAYTGALTQKQGRFEAANGSTIFLDEINSLSLDMQAKLLRVIQHGTFERLGSTKTIKVDVRIIAATNKDLNEEVSAGSFREDLYYRINVFPINVPPLRERPEDIPVLAWDFVNKFSKQMGKQIDTISANSMKTLKSHHWPGNVRELKNIIERAMITSQGTTLIIPHLETSVTYPAKSHTLDGVQRRHILEVLQKTGWRISGKRGAAQILAVNPKTLESRMKKLNIYRPKMYPDISGNS